MFKKAIKYEAKGRVALIGPAGSGKSLTSLKMGKALAGPDGKIAAIDTEHGSLSKYADLYDFDVCELDSFSPENFMKSLKAAEQAGYSVFMADSLSHFWMGKDGALEYVDMAKKRASSRDDMAGWKDFSPVERRMIDAMISSPCHIIVTMRTKTEYQEQEYTNARGERKKQRVKIGLAPVQRQGLEYEFDLIGYMDEDNNMVVDKSRCPAYARKALTRPSEQDFEAFVEWLKGAPAERGPMPVDVDSVGEGEGSAYLQNRVLQEKLAAASANGVDVQKYDNNAVVEEARKIAAGWSRSSFDTKIKGFGLMKTHLGEEKYRSTLNAAGYDNAQVCIKAGTRESYDVFIVMAQALVTKLQETAA